MPAPIVLRGLPPFAPFARAAAAFAGDRAWPASAGEFARHPGAGSENARYERGDEKVDVESWPTEVEAEAIDLDIREAGFVGVLEVLNEAGRKRVGAAVRQLDDDAAGNRSS